LARLGLVRSFQISAVFPHLTRLENVRVALQRQHGHSFDFAFQNGADRFNGRAHELLDDVGLSEFAATRGRDALRAQTRARNCNHAGARSGNDLLDSRWPAWARKTSTRSRPLIKRISAKYTILMVRTQSERRCQPFRHHHRADARSRAWPNNYADLSKDERAQGSLSGGRSCLI